MRNAPRTALARARAYDGLMPTLVEVGASRLSTPWRAACVVLCEQFPRDADVWARVTPGQACDLLPLIRDTARPMSQRVMLAVAQGIIDGATVVPVAELPRLSDRQLSSVLSALAIVRGAWPLD